MGPAYGTLARPTMTTALLLALLPRTDPRRRPDLTGTKPPMTRAPSDATLENAPFRSSTSSPSRVRSRTTSLRPVTLNPTVPATAQTVTRVGLAVNTQEHSNVMRAVVLASASPPMKSPSGSVIVTVPEMWGCVTDAVAFPYGLMSTAAVVPAAVKTLSHSVVVFRSCTPVNSKRYSREPPAAASVKVTKSESDSPDVTTAFDT